MERYTVGVQLDWQIEAESSREKIGEDAESKRRRRQARMRFFYFIAAVTGWFAIVGLLIWFRLYSVDNQLRDTLIQTAQAETAALRIGDAGVYMSYQRSASQDWINAQTDRFKRYQTLKAKSDVQLNGTVIDTSIDSQRGRVVLEEIIDNVSYRTVWYYWHYADGWRHVPSDYTFWGDDSTLTGKHVVIKYKGLDSDLAHTLNDRVDDWWGSGCALLNCDKITPLGTLTVTITPDQLPQMRWDANSPDDILIIPSPLASQEDRVKNDPGGGTTLAESAQQIASRLFDHATGNVRVAPFSDASWLRQNTVDWLAARFTGQTDLSRVALMQSLHDHYGDKGIAALAGSLTPNADIRILGDALRVPLDQLQVDWKPFFQWRLDLEKLILTSNAPNMQMAFFALWATDPNALNLARQRLGKPGEATPQVATVSIAPGADGSSVATVQTSDGGVLKFVLINGTWKREA
jgi:hypothetical protein